MTTPGNYTIHLTNGRQLSYKWKETMLEDSKNLKAEEIKEFTKGKRKLKTKTFQI